MKRVCTETDVSMELLTDNESLEEYIKKEMAMKIGLFLMNYDLVTHSEFIDSFLPHHKRYRATVNVISPEETKELGMCANALGEYEYDPILKDVRKKILDVLHK